LRFEVLAVGKARFLSSQPFSRI